MADGSREGFSEARGGKASGGRFGELEGDMQKVAERHAAAIARIAGETPAVLPRPWVERLGRHFLLARRRPE
jgi:hypothetical protein